MAAQNSDNGISGDGVFTSFLSGSSLHPTSGTSPKYDSIKMSFGSNLYHNNIAPAIASYIWKRTAQSVGEIPSAFQGGQAIGSFADDSNYQNYGLLTANAALGGRPIITHYTNDQSKIFTNNTGEDSPHNNLSPVVAAYLWKRTAQPVGELPNYSHTVYTDNNFCAVNTGNNNAWKQALANANTPESGVSYSVHIGAVGYNVYHNNIAPCRAVYIWKRTVQSVGEMPSHCHEQYVTANPGTGLYNTRKDYESDEINLNIFPQVNTGNTGGDLYHNNLPTVIATYCWKRIS